MSNQNQNQNQNYNAYGSQQPDMQYQAGGVVPGNPQQDNYLQPDQIQLQEPYGQSQQQQSKSFGPAQQSQYMYQDQSQFNSQMPPQQYQNQYPQQQPMQAIIIGEHNDGGGGMQNGGLDDIGNQDQNLPTTADKCNQAIRIKCPNCQSKVTTFITYEPGFWTIFCCILLGLLLFPCCFIPFLIEDCKDKVHKCPKCKVKVGVKRAFS